MSSACSAYLRRGRARRGERRRAAQGAAQRSAAQGQGGCVVAAAAAAAAASAPSGCAALRSLVGQSGLHRVDEQLSRLHLRELGHAVLRAVVQPGRRGGAMRGGMRAAAAAARTPPRRVAPVLRLRRAATRAWQVARACGRNWSMLSIWMPRLAMRSFTSLSETRLPAHRRTKTPQNRGQGGNGARSRRKWVSGTTNRAAGAIYAWRMPAPPAAHAATRAPSSE